MDDIIVGIITILSNTGNQKIADLLIDAKHEINETSRFGSRAHSTISYFEISSSPEKIALLNKLTKKQKEKIKNAAILYYPIQDNSPEIIDVIFKVVVSKGNNNNAIKKKLGDTDYVNSLNSGTTYGIVIAIENYNESVNFPKVDYAEKDANDFIETFKILGYDTEYFTPLINQNATKTTILSKIKTISQKAEVNDRIIIYFAGHGFYEGGKNLLASVDAVKTDKIDTCISIEHILGHLGKSLCRQNLLFLDCCHSGFIISNNERQGEDSFETEELIYQFRNEEFCIGFASCKSNQKSISHSKLNNGVWSHFLNQALRGSAKGIYDGNLLFSDKLQNYLKEQTSQFVKMHTETKKDQTPIKFGMETDKFIIADLTQIVGSKRPITTEPKPAITNSTSSSDNVASNESITLGQYDDSAVPKPVNSKLQKIKDFTIQLSSEFSFTQHDAIVKNIILEIIDLRKAKIPYNLKFHIEGISHELEEYESLNSLTDPEVHQLEKKIELREHLNQYYYLEGATIYDYLEYSMNCIIDYSYEKLKYLTTINDLFSAIRICFSYYSNNSFEVKSDTVKFYVFKRGKLGEWGFSIYIPEEEADKMCKTFGTTNRQVLGSFAGLDIYDLSRESRLYNAIPKQSFTYTCLYFTEKEVENYKNEYFQIGDWKIAID